MPYPHDSPRTCAINPCRASPSTDHSDKPILTSSTFQHRINRLHIHILLDMVGPAIQFSSQLRRDEIGS